MEKTKIKNTDYIYIYINFATIICYDVFNVRAVIISILRRNLEKQVFRQLAALQGNLALVFENVTQLSTYLYFDDIVQDSLRQINSANIDLNYQKNITKSLFNMILSGDYVSGVYIFDQYNNCYSSYKRTPRKVNKYIQGADWYKKMQSAGWQWIFL